jgi:hypothetical protein
VNWLTAIADLWSARRTSTLVTRTLSPAIGGTVLRLGGVPAHAWLDPYALGFVVTLVTLVAGTLRNHGPQGLGFVQVDCWQRLTGVKDGALGERICLLSAGSDPAFMRGSRDARDYYLRKSESGGLLRLETFSPRISPLEAPTGGSGGAEYVWSTTIERHLGAALGLELLCERDALDGDAASCTG